MPRQQVARALVKNCGFSEQWVSQVWRVANSTDEVFARYMEGMLGFRAALQEARSKPEEPTKGQQKRKWKERLLAFAHKVGKIAVEQDTDFVVVLPEVGDALTRDREVRATVGPYEIHVTKKA